MADIQLPALPAAVSGDNTDLLHIRQGAIDKKLTIDTLKSSNLNNDYIQITGIIDSVGSTSIVNPLSANQGKFLNDKIDALTPGTIGAAPVAHTHTSSDITTLASTTNKSVVRYATQGEAQAGTDTDSVIRPNTLAANFVNTVSSTSIVRALTANQGKVLNDTINALDYSDVGAYQSGSTVANSSLLDGFNTSTTDLPNTVAVRNSSGNLRADTFEASDGNTGSISSSSAVCTRSSAGAAMQFATKSAFIDYLGFSTDTSLNSGNGWSKSGDTGVTFQWGSAIITNGGGGGNFIGFPTTFSSVFQGWAVWGTPGSVTSLVTDSFSTSGITVSSAGGTGGSRRVRWFAVGLT